ncbi:MAG: hypothetical protein ACJATT_002791, partial [Myxococcota bacterium]
VDICVCADVRIGVSIDLAVRVIAHGRIRTAIRTRGDGGAEKEQRWEDATHDGSVTDWARLASRNRVSVFVRAGAVALQ